MIRLENSTIQDVLSDRRLFSQAVQSVTAEELQMLECIVEVRKLVNEGIRALVLEAAKPTRTNGWRPIGARKEFINKALGIGSEDCIWHRLYILGNSVKPVIIFILINSYNSDKRSDGKPKDQFMAWPLVVQIAFVDILMEMQLHPEIETWVARIPLPSPNKRDLWFSDHQSLKQAAAETREPWNPDHPPKRRRLHSRSPSPSKLQQPEGGDNFQGKNREVTQSTIPTGYVPCPPQYPGYFQEDVIHSTDKPILNWTIGELCDSLQTCSGGPHPLIRLAANSNTTVRIDVTDRRNRSLVCLMIPRKLLVNLVSDLHIPLATLCDGLRDFENIKVCPDLNCGIGIALLPKLGGIMVFTVRGLYNLWGATAQKRQQLA